MIEKYKEHNNLTLGEQAADEFTAGLDDQKNPNRFIQHNYERYKALFDIAQKSAARAEDASKQLEIIPTVEDQMDALDSWQDYATFEEFKEASNIGEAIELAPQAIRSMTDAEVAKGALASHLEETRAHLLLDDKTMNKMYAGASKENEKFDKVKAKEEKKRSKELAPCNPEQKLKQAKDEYWARRTAVIESALHVAPFFPGALNQYEELRAITTNRWNDLVPDHAQLNGALNDILFQKGKTYNESSYHGDERITQVYEEFQNGESALRLTKIEQTEQPTSTYITCRGDEEFSYRHTGEDFIALNMQSGLSVARQAAETLLPNRALEWWDNPRRGVTTRRDINRNAKKITEILRGKIQELDSLSLEEIAFEVAQKLLTAGEVASREFDRKAEILPPVLEALRANDTVREAYERTSGQKIHSDIDAQHSTA